MHEMRLLLSLLFFVLGVCPLYISYFVCPRREVPQGTPVTTGRVLRSGVFFFFSEFF
jgi:hypothetical protein